MRTPQASPPTPDLLTLLSVATLVYVLAKVIHEGLGHGLSCVLEGGRLVGVSSAFAQCDFPGQTLLQRRIAVASGTLLNLLVAAVAFAWLRHRTPRTGWAYYALWLTTAVNGLMGAGYLMVDPLFGFGDWTVFIAGLEPRWAYRVAFSGVGCLLTLRWFFLLYPALTPLLGGASNLRAQARRLCLLPWAVVGGGVMTLGAWLNYLGPRYAFTSALATVGGTFLLVWIPMAFRREPSSEPGLPWGGNTGWRIAGFAALAFLLLGLGPGFRF